ncbi:uncharacterized protein B0T23DRAFT_319707 [Neurospora hispaniola]|uniref:Uncharacterized protein n=1 Tax=Neurospora hispaniola TaxID=588809 RepID=A0AAJ0I532_9PEZI|nr:hypothetical protein B0T23DRAFT_319707 [Neurospora hispaniola]
MAVSQTLLVIPKWAEFQEQAKGGVIIEIHSRHVSAHELKDTLETMFPHSKYTIQVSIKPRSSLPFSLSV